MYPEARLAPLHPTVSMSVSSKNSHEINAGQEIVRLTEKILELENASKL